MRHRPATDFKMSIERINNFLGYTKDNVTLIISEMNTSKQWNYEKVKYAFYLVSPLLQHPQYDEIFQKKYPPIITSKKKIFVDGVMNIMCYKCRIYKTHNEFSNIKGKCDTCMINSVRLCLSGILTNMKSSQESRNSKNYRENFVMDITIQDLFKQLQKQHGKCYYSNINLNFSVNSDWHCSVERLDTKKGYLKENVVFICNEFNSADRSVIETSYDKEGSCGWSKEKFLTIKQSVLDYNNYYK